MVGLLQDILCVLQGMADVILSALVLLVNLLIFSLSGWISLLVLLMPAMPATPDPIGGSVLEFVNWFYPVGGLVAGLATFLVLWAAWLAIRIPLRWAKVV